MLNIKTDFGSVMEAIYHWDAIPNLLRMEGTIPDAEITRAIAHAYQASMTIPVSDMPPITADDPSYLAVKQWIDSGRDMGRYDHRVSMALYYSEQWIKDSRNRP